MSRLRVGAVERNCFLHNSSRLFAKLVHSRIINFLVDAGGYLINSPEVLSVIRVVRKSRGERFGNFHGARHFRFGFRLTAFPRKRITEIGEAFGLNSPDFRIARICPSQFFDAARRLLKQRNGFGKSVEVNVTHRIFDLCFEQCRFERKRIGIFSDQFFVNRNGFLSVSDAAFNVVLIHSPDAEQPQIFRQQPAVFRIVRINFQ